MSATNRQADRTATATGIDPPTANLWGADLDTFTTEDEEDRARIHNLSKGNATEIGYDHQNSSEGRENKDGWHLDYEKLDSHNRDNHWKYREDVDVAGDCDRQLKLKMAFGIASQLGLSDFHKQLVLERLFAIDGSRFGHRLEAVCFCLCAIVVNEEADRHPGSAKVYHPQRNESNNDDTYVRVQNQLIDRFGGLSETRFQSIYGKLAHGDSPTAQGEETRSFLAANSQVQQWPSVAPDYALPQPASEA